MADNSTDFIPCMLLPLQEHYLLLPNTTIAEVVPMPRIEIVDNKPDFWVGYHQWQNQQIAIVDLESLVNNTPYESGSANKLCVIYSINDNLLQAYALPCHGAPQLIHLNESALKLVNYDNESDYLHCRTLIGNKTTFIPNLDKLEQTVLDNR